MRVVGQLLEFLSSDDSKEVFTIMTSNDVSQLPPELTRSGRLDATWFFDLPTEEERKQIFRIHFAKKNVTDLSEDFINFCAKITQDYTGAEIEGIVKNAILKAFIEHKKTGNQYTVSKLNISEAVDETIPVSKSSREKINALKNYAADRARFANKIINDNNNMIYNEL